MLMIMKFSSVATCWHIVASGANLSVTHNVLLWRIIRSYTLNINMHAEDKYNIVKVSRAVRNWPIFKNEEGWVPHTNFYDNNNIAQTLVPTTFVRCVVWFNTLSAKCQCPCWIDNGLDQRGYDKWHIASSKKSSCHHVLRAPYHACKQLLA
jgi:hypothetical protein